MWTELHRFGKLQATLLASVAVAGVSGGVVFAHGAGLIGSDGSEPAVQAADTIQATATVDAGSSAGTIADSTNTATVNPSPITDLIPSRRGSGPANRVVVMNHEDERFRARGSLDFAAINGDTVRPVNEAYAETSCTDCQTVAVAGQIVVYEAGASNVSPGNFAIAINLQCLRCVTIALAYQFVIPIDDLEAVPEDAKHLVQELDHEFKEIEKIQSLREVSPAEVEARINDIVGRFQQFAGYLLVSREERRSDDSETPSPTAAASPSPAASAAPSGTPPSAAGASPSASTTPTEAPSATSTP